MKAVTKSVIYWSCFFIVLCMVSCTHVVNPSLTTKPYPKQQKLDLSAILLLPASLHSAKIENNLAGDNWVILLGDSLIRNSRGLVEGLFAHASSVDEGTEVIEKNADIVLVPRLVTAQSAHAVWRYDESTVTLAIEWTAKDNNGNVILVDTVKGEGKSAGGSGFAAKDDVEKRVNTALARLFLNSYKTLYESPVLKLIEKRKRKL